VSEVLDLDFVKTGFFFILVFRLILPRGTLCCVLHFMAKFSASSAGFDSSFVFYIVPVECVYDTSETEA
jgi:hypothetical protein